MNNSKEFPNSKNKFAKMQVIHLGKILFNLQFIPVVIMFASVLSFIVPALYYLFLIILAGITLFAIVADEKYRYFWTDGAKNVENFVHTMQQSWAYTVPITIVIASISILCLSFDKYQKHIARISVSSVALLAAVIILIVQLSMPDPN